MDDIDFLTISIEKLLVGYVNKEFITKTAKEIVKKANEEKNENKLTEFLLEIIKKNKEENVSDFQLNTLAKILIIQIKNLYLCKKETA